MKLRNFNWNFNEIRKYVENKNENLTENEHNGFNGDKIPSV